MWKELSGAPIRRSDPSGTGPDRRGYGWSGSTGLGRRARRDRPAPARPASHWRGRGRLPNSCPACPRQVRRQPKQGARNGCRCPASRGRLVAIGIAGPVVELWAQQHIDRQAVPGRGPAERAGRHLGQGRALANDFNMRELLDDVPIAGQHDPDIGRRDGAPWEGRRKRQRVRPRGRSRPFPSLRTKPSRDALFRARCCYARTGPISSGNLEASPKTRRVR